MSRRASSDEWNRMLELIAEIEACNEYLKFYKIRMGLHTWTRAKLVSVQLSKAKFIAELKMFARNFEIIPQSVRTIYY